MSVWPDTVLFADGSEWSDNGMLQCAYRGDNTQSVPIGIDERSAIPVVGHTRLAAGQPGQTPGNPTSAEQKMALIRRAKPRCVPFAPIRLEPVSSWMA